MEGNIEQTLGKALTRLHAMKEAAISIACGSEDTEALAAGIEAMALVTIQEIEGNLATIE